MQPSYYLLLAGWLVQAIVEQHNVPLARVTCNSLEVRYIVLGLKRRRQGVAVTEYFIAMLCV